MRVRPFQRILGLALGLATVAAAAPIMADPAPLQPGARSQPTKNTRGLAKGPPARDVAPSPRASSATTVEIKNNPSAGRVALPVVPKAVVPKAVVPDIDERPDPETSAHPDTITQNPARVAGTPNGTVQPVAWSSDGYCRAIAEIAAKRHDSAEKDGLAQLAVRVEDRMVLLDQKIASLKEWVAKRDALVARAKDAVSQIYGRMTAEAAALQLLAMPENTAAAVIYKLETKQASAIMAEMDATKAARLSSIIAAIGEVGSAAEATPVKGANP
jgi:hypothetical protein